MKPFVCLVIATSFTLMAIASSHAAFMPRSAATASAGMADTASSAFILIRAGGGNRNANRQNFNANNFHNNVSANHNVNRNSNVNVNRNSNVNVNRNSNVNVNRNVVVHGGGGCCVSYNSGPGWGGVAAGVAVGAVVGAAVTSAAQPPPTYYPPGSVYVPAY
jgi:hypothetical protein